MLTHTPYAIHGGQRWLASASSCTLIRVRLLPFLLSSLLLGAAACDASPPDTSLGELGQVQFSYRRSCFFGCPLEQPLLVGTREEISLSSRGSGAGVTAQSSDEDVASFSLVRTCFCQRGKQEDDRIEVTDGARCSGDRSKVCEARVQVEAHTSGEAKLELMDADGEPIDRALVYVREAASARFWDGRGRSVERLELAQGEDTDLELKLYDDEGQRLLAPEGVHWRAGSGDVAHVSAWLIGSGRELDAGLSVTVQAEAEGSDEVSVDVPGLEASLPLRVR